jgi:Cu+-exporting ATPase
MAGTGKGAENGILIKNGETLERARKINTVVFDKTGTITEGKPEVTDIILGTGGWGLGNGKLSPELFLQLTAAAEKGSEHPLGQTIVREAEKRGLTLPSTAEFKALPGEGIEAKISDPYSSALINSSALITVLAGNKKLMNERGIVLGELEEVSGRLAAEGKTPMYIAFDNCAVGIIASADVLKKNSKATVTRLCQMGLNVIMITGDNKKTGEAIAREAGIGHVLSEVLPGDKSAEIKKLQAEGHKAAMVGDGINDAPALVQADIGIAIGSGTDVAIESADMVLMHNDPLDVPKAITLSRKTIRVIKQNLFWAFGYNVLGIPIAAGALYLFGGPLLNPIFAAAAMSLSSVSVLANALRLRRTRL